MNKTRSPGTEANLAGRINCPRCKNPIHFPVQALLQVKSLTCTNCGLELEIDQQKSGLALRELHKLASSLDDSQARHA